MEVWKFTCYCRAVPDDVLAPLNLTLPAVYVLLLASENSMSGFCFELADSNRPPVCETAELPT